ncbi:unnamed protein product [Ectocarpus sp. 13 AM-2016]
MQRVFNHSRASSSIMAQISRQEFRDDVLASQTAHLGVASRASFFDDTGSGGFGGSGKDSSDAESGDSEYNFKIAIIGPGGLGGAMLRHLKDLGDVETALIACDERGGIIRHTSPVGPIRSISGGLSRNSSGSSSTSWAPPAAKVLRRMSPELKALLAAATSSSWFRPKH